MRHIISRIAVRRTPLSSLLVIASALVCSMTIANCSSTATSSSESRHGSITANPNPVPAGPGFGTSTISWNTADGSHGQVYVVEGSNAEKLFADDTVQGSLDAPWIGSGGAYEFRLYAGKDHQKLLASVRVVRAAK
jgi:hypothetical protein